MALIGNLVVRLAMESRSFKSGLKSAAASVASFQGLTSKSLSTVGKGFMAFPKIVGKSLTAVGLVLGKMKDMLSGMASWMWKWQKRILTWGLLPLVAGMVYVGAGFERAMSRVRALTGATAQEFIGLRDVAKILGETTIYSAKQAAEGMSYLALAGFKANDIMQAMPGVLSLAAAGMMEVGTASDIVAKIMAGMGIKANQVGMAVDVMTAAFTNANTTLEQLGEALAYVGPISKLVGKGIHETTAALMMLSNAGLQASLAGTGLRGIFAQLSGSNAAAAKEIKRLGIQVKNSLGDFRPLADIIDDFNAALGRVHGKAAVAASIFTIFGKRAGPAFSAMLNQGGDTLRGFIKILEKSAGAAAMIAAVQNNNVYGSFIMLKSVVAGIGIRIWENLKDRVKEYIDGITNWLRKNKNAIVDWATNAGNKVLDFLDKLKALSSQVSDLRTFGQTIGQAFTVIAMTYGEMLTIIASKAGVEFGVGFIGGVNRAIADTWVGKVIGWLGNNTPGEKAFRPGVGMIAEMEAAKRGLTDSSGKPLDAYTAMRVPEIEAAANKIWDERNAAGMTATHQQSMNDFSQQLKDSYDRMIAQLELIAKNTGTGGTVGATTP